MAIRRLIQILFEATAALHKNEGIRVSYYHYSTVFDNYPL
jgi:hypothetical protein